MILTIPEISGIIKIPGIQRAVKTMVCTFFGHKDAPTTAGNLLLPVLIDLIENKNVTLFYVGNNGNFDNLVRKNLKMLKNEYPEIDYAVVLSALPVKKKIYPEEDYSDTIFPDILEKTPPKYAISKRNLWMINESDYVVAYVEHTIGGAAQFMETAMKKGKTVINLAKQK